MTLEELIAQREAIDAEMLAAHERWIQCNAQIVAGFSPHNINDEVEFDKYGKKFKLKVRSVSVVKSMNTGQMFLSYRGKLIRKDGTVGIKSDDFMVPLTGEGK
jgi:hypothetical protein